MSLNAASRTAMATAWLRAAHQVLDAGARVLDDPLAVRLLGAGAIERLHADRDRYFSPLSLSLRAHVVWRSRYAEDRLAAAVQQGVARYIVLGAGLDTFAYRQPPWARDLRIIEIDHPASQRLKRSMLDRASIAIPDNVTLLGLDLERQGLAEGLRHAGLDAPTVTFFSWLGVTMYLSAAAIDITLRTMATVPAGSQAVITFMQPPSPNDPLTHQLQEQVSAHQEPFVSTFTPEQFASALRSAGFARVDVPGVEEAAVHFTDCGPLAPPLRASLAWARVS